MQICSEHPELSSSLRSLSEPHKADSIKCTEGGRQEESANEYSEAHRVPAVLNCAARFLSLCLDGRALGITQTGGWGRRTRESAQSQALQCSSTQSEHSSETCTLS